MLLYAILLFFVLQVVCVTYKKDWVIVVSAHFQPSYGEFDISGNVLGLVFNQGMIWYELINTSAAHARLPLCPCLHAWVCVAACISSITEWMISMTLSALGCLLQWSHSVNNSLNDHQQFLHVVICYIELNNITLCYAMCIMLLCYTYIMFFPLWSVFESLKF